MYMANRHCRWHIGRNATFVMDATQRDCTCNRDTLHKLNHFSNEFDKSKLSCLNERDLSFARMRIEEAMLKKLIQEPNAEVRNGRNENRRTDDTRRTDDAEIDRAQREPKRIQIR